MTSTLPQNRIVFADLELLEHHVQGMYAMVVHNNSAGTADRIADVDLGGTVRTLNLLSLSSLNKKQVGPISLSR